MIYLVDNNFNNSGQIAHMRTDYLSPHRTEHDTAPSYDGGGYSDGGNSGSGGE